MCQTKESEKGHRSMVVFALAGLLLLGSALPSRGQEVTGAVTGTVTDPSGAAVPGAQITAKDTLRGTVWPTQTNGAGVYNLPRLPVGSYTIQAETTGFATAVRPAFEIEMNQVYRVDFELKVGAVSQTVDVTSAPPLLQTDTMQVGLVTSSDFNVNLPLPTHNFVELTLLTPGVTTPNPTTLESGQRTYFSGRTYVNGNREEGNNLLLDGIDNNETLNNLTAYQPSVDAIRSSISLRTTHPLSMDNFRAASSAPPLSQEPTAFMVMPLISFGTMP